VVTLTCTEKAPLTETDNSDGAHRSLSSTGGDSYRRDLGTAKGELKVCCTTYTRLDQPTHLYAEPEKHSDPRHQPVDESPSERRKTNRQDPDQTEETNLECIISVRRVGQEKGQRIPVILKDS
jgi:hypothetical protein